MKPIGSAIKVRCPVTRLELHWVPLWDSATLLGVSVQLFLYFAVPTTLLLFFWFTECHCGTAGLGVLCSALFVPTTLPLFVKIRYHKLILINLKTLNVTLD